MPGDGERILRISVPVMISDGLLDVGENVQAIIIGHIGSQFVSANAITLVAQRVSTIFITGISFSDCFIVGKTWGESGMGSQTRLYFLFVWDSHRRISRCDYLPHQRFYGELLRCGEGNQKHSLTANGCPEPDCRVPSGKLHFDKRSAQGRR